MESRELEQLLAKVGGKYKLVSLYQKRMRELMRGLPRLVETDNPDHWNVVCQEIMQGKVDLLMGEAAETLRKELALREAEEAAAAGEGDKDKKPKAIEAKAE